MNLVRCQLAAGEHPIEARVARTPEQRALGLMHRVEMAPNEGMLFVCDECAVQKFWMKDTPVALSIAFLEEDGTIVHLDEMEPNSLETCSCDQPVRYVLEMPQGWFRERGIRAGTRITGPVFLRALATAS
ncbi:MAG TPA: DUF192 domain-containing protein [Ramlibacter sp.]|jgi:uncharacterized membrane protein (UPF0127 family)|uniref:DUF192 domain-containing protein n=1 Tax=Ramlibacter sp. TaxID=1917967 RepID=UPI002D6C33F9|nr:DUF192 domain-containing protein [Ramlibacter sp.]HZY18757.1 DUF192 domain-containing protein [Ramlibacter sp.]